MDNNSVLPAICRTSLIISHASLTTYGGRSSPELYRGWLELLMMPMVFMGNPLPPTPTLLNVARGPYPAGRDYLPSSFSVVELPQDALFHLKNFCCIFRGHLEYSITYCDVRFLVCVSDFFIGILCAEIESDVRNVSFCCRSKGIFHFCWRSEL